MHYGRAGAREVGHVEARERRAPGDALLVLPEALGSRVVARYRKAEAVLEIEPADLAVGHDIQADAFLQRHMLLHAFEFDPCEFMRGKLLAFQPGAGILPRSRPQQAADDIGANALEVNHA